jgi:hypothetical protein
MFSFNFLSIKKITLWSQFVYFSRLFGLLPRRSSSIYPPSLKLKVGNKKLYNRILNENILEGLQSKIASKWKNCVTNF